MKNTLTKSLQVGKVELFVKDLSEMKSFYTSKLLLEIISEETGIIVLGKNQTPLIGLHSKEDLSFASSHQAGLYHFAILYSSRSELAKTIQNILQKSPESFSGSGDHLVSEAFYFYDPEGNGIELYFDRERTTWIWENNQIKMATIFIDPIEYIQKYLVVEDKQSKNQMGHIHLKVGDVNKAKEFYVDLLGFDITAQLPHALFISIGKYHHHIGINSWESFGALKRKPSLGLKSFELILDNNNDILDVKERLNAAEIPYEEEKNMLVFEDPWKNQIRLISHDSSTSI